MRPATRVESQSAWRHRTAWCGGAVEKFLSYSYHVPYCVPYWTPATYWVMLRCCLTGQVTDGTQVQRLMERLASFFVVPMVLPCKSGRVAIELALRALGVSAGAEVVVPTFCCSSVIPPIVAVGAIPVLADVGNALHLTPETVEAALSSVPPAPVRRSGSSRHRIPPAVAPLGRRRSGVG